MPLALANDPSLSSHQSGGSWGVGIGGTMLSWMAGVVLSLGWAELPSPVWPWAVVAALLAVLSATLAWVIAAVCADPPTHPGRRWRAASPWLWCALWLAVWLCAALMAVASTAHRAHERQARALPDELEGRSVELIGRIDGLVRHTPSGLLLPVRVESVPGWPHAKGARVQLSWVRGGGSWSAPGITREAAALDSDQRLAEPGQVWRWQVKLRRVHGVLNPYGWDEEAHGFGQELAARASVDRRSTPTRLTDAAGWSWDAWRQAGLRRLEGAVPDPRAQSLLLALSIGDQSKIPPEDSRVYQITGVAHLVSISGLHVTMFAVMAAAAVGWAWRRSRVLMQWWAAPRAAAWMGLVVCGGYVLLAGSGVPAQRTWFMLACVTALRSLGPSWPWPFIWLAAACAVTCVDPWAWLQVGFHLSFGAVAVLLASGSGLEARAVHDRADQTLHWHERLGRVLQESAHAQWVATVGLTPLTLIMFHQVSVLGFVANALAIPWVSLVVTPLALLGYLWSGFWTMGAWCIDVFWAWVHWLSLSPWAVWHGSAAPVWAQAMGLLSVWMWVTPWPWSWRCLSALAWAPLLWPVHGSPTQGHFQMWAVDVGQGNAVWIRTRHHDLLYDAGPALSADFDAGERVVLPFLRAQGVGALDALVISHSDLDHAGGARAILDGLDVKALHSSLPRDHPLHALMAQRQRPSQACDAGGAWQWDGVQFEWLHPQPQHQGVAWTPNERSCVLRIRAQNGQGPQVLLAGDIERAGEAALLAGRRESLVSEVLLVPHHGSKTSSSQAFIEAVRPQWAVVQSGYRNRYGHPASVVMARYRQQKVEVVRSTQCGAWQWQSHTPGQGQCWRDQVRRYWHTPG